MFQTHGLTGLVLTPALATSAQAQSLTWDANGAASAVGAGTWDPHNLRWYNGTSCQGWDNAALNDAAFGIAAGTLSAPILQEREGAKPQSTATDATNLQVGTGPRWLVPHRLADRPRRR